MRTSTILKRSSIPVALLLSLSVLPASNAAVPASMTPWASAPAEEDRPGDRHWIDPDDLPEPVNEGDPEAPDFNNPPTVVDRPEGVMPEVPRGFEVEEFASGLDTPRVMRLAPNGDVFLSESGAGRVLVFAADAEADDGADDELAAEPEVFAEGLDRPFGIAFYPEEDPEWVYVAAADQVVRYPYSEGDTEAAGPAEVIIADIPTERHWTRDLAVAPDGEHLFVSIGSASNVAGAMPDEPPVSIDEWEEEHGRGAAWGDEEDRAVVRVFDPEGDEVRNYATGLRNCSGMTVQPDTEELWCTGNERDHLGADLVPDYLTTVQEEGFYGWPWFYTGGHEDPAHAGERPDLQDEVITPDVLIQAHSSTLQMVFYDADAFSRKYQDDAFATLRGSWNREIRTGYKVIRAVFEDGEATGEYVDFMTGFALNEDEVYGRPTGIVVTQDGDLLVSEDANGTIYRVSADRHDCDHHDHHGHHQHR